MPPNSGARSPTAPPTLRLALAAVDFVADGVGACVAEVAAAVFSGPEVSDAAVSDPVVADGCPGVADDFPGWAVAELPHAANNKTKASAAAATTGNLLQNKVVRSVVNVMIIVTLWPWISRD